MVEVGPGLRTGGTAVDIRGQTVGVVERMGILDAIRADRLSLQRWEMKNAEDRTERMLVLRAEGDPHLLEQYFSITIVDKLLIGRDTAQMFNVPGETMILNAYKNNTDVICSFVSEQELSYDRHDEAQLRQIIRDRFAGIGWRAQELLREVDGSTSFETLVPRTEEAIRARNSKTSNDF